MPNLDESHLGLGSTDTIRVPSVFFGCEYPLSIIYPLLYASQGASRLRPARKSSIFTMRRSGSPLPAPYLGSAGKEAPRPYLLRISPRHKYGRLCSPPLATAQILSILDNKSLRYFKSHKIFRHTASSAPCPPLHRTVESLVSTRRLIMSPIETGEAEMPYINRIGAYVLTLFISIYVVVLIVSCTRFMSMVWSNLSTSVRTATLDTKQTGEENTMEPEHGCKCLCRSCKCPCHKG
jgi:hypothetical protein